MTENGFVLILVLCILMGFMMIGFFMLDHFLIQSKINQNLYLELKTYYLAQAGIEYAIYRLEKLPTWRTKNWQADLKDAGQIRLYITSESDKICVDSIGIYQEYECKLTAYFTKTIPVQRIK